jgi:hypothetical protein
VLCNIHQVWNQLGNLGYNCNFELIPEEIEGFLELPTSTAAASSTVNQDGTAATASATVADAVSADMLTSANTSDNSGGDTATASVDAAVDDAMDTVEASETEPSTVTRYNLRVHCVLCSSALL